MATSGENMIADLNPVDPKIDWTIFWLGFVSLINRDPRASGNSDDLKRFSIVYTYSKVCSILLIPLTNPSTCIPMSSPQKIDRKRPASAEIPQAKRAKTNDDWMVTLMEEMSDQTPFTSHKARDALPESLVLGGFVLNQTGNVLYKDEPALDNYPRVTIPMGTAKPHQWWRFEYYLHDESKENVLAPVLRKDEQNGRNRKREHKMMSQSQPTQDNVLWVRAPPNPDQENFTVKFQKTRNAWKLSCKCKYALMSSGTPQFVFVAIPCSDQGKPEYSKAIRCEPFAVKSKRQPKDTAVRNASTRVPKRTRRTAETEQIDVQIRDAEAEILRFAAENKRLSESNSSALKNAELFVQVSKFEQGEFANLFQENWTNSVNEMRRRFR